MKKIILYFFLFLLADAPVFLKAQHELAAKFFASVPSLISGYPSPGNPCENAIEFTVNTNEKNTISMVAENSGKDSKGKTKVKVSEKGNKTIWYKIIFQTDCELTFRIYSDKAADTYHYFVYQQVKETDFCRNLSDKKLIPIRANMLEHKEGIIGTGISDGIKINYKDTTEFYFKRTLRHTPFLDGIKGKAGDTYFINIYHVDGTDDFHYLVLNACYREVNLKTENDNIGSEKSKIIEKLPEHVTKPSPEKTQAEKDSLAAIEKENEEKKKAEAIENKNAALKTKADELARKKAEKEAAEKAKAESAEKKIAEALAKKKEAEEAKRKSVVKKISPQLVSFDEKDSLGQYILEGEIVYGTDTVVPLPDVEVYFANSGNEMTIFKKMYSTEKGLFRFANLPLGQPLFISLNTHDSNLPKEKEPVLKGKLFLEGKPAAGVLINNLVKTGTDGGFILKGKDLFIININDLFNRWSVDLSNPNTYSEMIKKYGGVSLNGLVYRVQIGAYREEANFDYSFMNDLGKVDKQALADGITRFVMGEFNTLKEAEVFKQKALERKINDAFILAYFNGSKKYLEELIERNMLENK